MLTMSPGSGGVYFSAELFCLFFREFASSRISLATEYLTSSNMLAVQQIARLKTRNQP
jgi:hypothetical protein